ncbi:MAG TPA: ABC transporter permease [Arthrobacter sp.]|nr:ABC transporter permease [Arthrobacter sp.]
MPLAIVRRIVQAIPTMLLVSVAVFVIIRLIPGDPAAAMAGSDASKATLAAIRAHLGLDEPIYVQYWDWLQGALSGNLGTSLSTHRPVSMEVAPRALFSFQLVGMSMLLAVVVGVGTGMVAAYRRGGLVDRLTGAANMLFISVPTYWVGLMLILLFAVHLDILPAGGNETYTALILPVIVLALPQIGMLAQLTRGAFTETLALEYVQFARQKGVRERRILLRHALPNCGVTILSFAGVQLGHLLAGAVVVEVVFALPGLGRLAVNSLLVRDLPLVQGTILVFAVAVVLINLVTDILYSVIDPRIEA